MLLRLHDLLASLSLFPSFPGSPSATMASALARNISASSSSRRGFGPGHGFLKLPLGVDPTVLQSQNGVDCPRQVHSVLTVGEVRRKLASEFSRTTPRNPWKPCCNLAGRWTHLSLIHISEPTRLLSISYAVFCLKKKKKQTKKYSIKQAENAEIDKRRM
eukprot:TRINITY_DN5031_c0_g1_i12.p1 TRINITY_DN5031_c0_g1~~TRINITY_DN5031_c0_g1_i12.p1  ORF type:complete len:160 (-),score=19.62 TRINITY_DN5031_c0_g1_i12:37-516(-)